MKRLTYYTFIAFYVVLFGCSSSIESRFPMEKRYWGSEDYNHVIQEIKFETPKGKRFPEFSNPETAPVIRKLTDSQNFLVVLEDEELGINHRNEVSQEFFNRWKNLANLYSNVDRQDKYIYGRELLAIQQFGLDLQLHYFSLGNRDILQDADDPNSKGIKNLVNSNEKVIFSNYNNYLDLTNREYAFNDEELTLYAEGINKYFPRLFDTFPNGPLGITKNKAELMYKKAEHPSVKEALSSLLELINQHLP